MNQEIKDRIEKIKKGVAPEGYIETKIGILPESWNVVELKNKFDRITQKNEINNQNVLTISAQSGLISQNDFFNKIVASDNKVNYFLLNKGDFAYNKSYSNGYPFGAIKVLKNFDNGVVSPLYICFKPNNKNRIPEYYEHYFESGKHNREINSIAQEGARNHGLLNMSVIDFFNTYIPDFDNVEQQKIASILSTWDKAIELKEKLIEEKKTQKKGLMQKLLTGEVRLPGFDGEWKEVQIGKYGYTFNGLSGKNAKDFDFGKPYITYMNIFSNSKINLKQVGYVDIKRDEKQCMVKYGDIFFTTSSETPVEVAMSSVLLDSVDEMYLNSFCFGYRLKDFNTLLPQFLRFYLRGSRFRKETYKLAQGSTRFNISKNEVMKIKISIPGLKEQKAISQVLETVEQNINLLEQELEAIKLQKKGLMQLLLTGIIRTVSDNN